MTTKATLRAELKARLRGLSPSERRRQSEALCHLLAADPRLQQVRTLGAFIPLPDEPDITHLLRDALSRGVRLGVPAPDEGGIWRFAEVRALSPLAPGPLGVPLPPLGQTLPVEEFEMILVPGRGFTPDGDRLGRGKGIYDRLLLHATGDTCGVAFDVQRLGVCPHEPHDLRMRRVVFAPSKKGR